MIRAYFGHHKCGSTWIRNIVEGVLNEIGIVHRLAVDPNTPSGHGPLTDYHEEFTRDEIASWVKRNNLGFVSFITADQSQADALPGVKGFHVIRDPRDIIVSAYFSHRNSHPTEGLDHLAEHREKLKSVSEEEGLMLEMDFSASELNDLNSWNYNNPDILELKMESITSCSYEPFIEIFRFLDLLEEKSTYPASRRTQVYVNAMRNRLARRGGLFAGLRQEVAAAPELVLGRVFDFRFEKISGGRKKGTEDTSSHYRKGVAGDWKNYFNAEHCTEFNSRFSGILQATGYESDDAWIEGQIRSLEGLKTV